ncbi:MAG: succinate-semialdehyde dehydrogenase/glutarate-semialdehyde dehydrogenase [Planctomycetota bacterium]|jgi:succinate-semialdehyde dehydrogenase/glutarate-semialdehyde dehydrogenase
MSSFSDLDPATGEAIEQISSTTPAQLSAAVARARAAADGWGRMPVDERLRRLRSLTVGLEARADELADMITREMGKTRASAMGEVQGYTQEVTQICEELELALAPEDFGGKNSQTQLVRMPLGVVAAIAPWNFPLGMPLSILIPALGAGNSVVFKPSEHVPRTGAMLAELLQEVLPPGVLELVQGAGDVGAALVESDIDMIGFVGSRDTGARIMAAAAGQLKRLVLELGGKDPMVVFADADLEAAAKCAVDQSLRNTGQVCCSVERVYVADSVAAEFEALVLERARGWSHGNGFDESSRMGPMVSELQRDKVATQVEEAVAGGARLLLGGEKPDGPGFFYPATVLAGVSQEQRITHDETFGPVVSLTTFNGEEDTAVELANDTPYGLGACVWSADGERAARVAARLRAGQVGVNRYLGGAPGTPWVGARQSGFGFLGGVEGHRQFTTPKTICTAR